MGVRRKQIETYNVEKDLTTWLELDLAHLIPVKKPEDLPDSMAQEPTWGQWFVWFWAKGVVGKDRILFEDDIRGMAREGVCFDDGIISLDADFFGTANRAMRLEFWPPKKADNQVQAFPWADFPERWKLRGVQDLRNAVGKELGLEMAPRKRGAHGEIRVLMTTRKGDWRRMWSNAEAGVEALRKEFGDRLKVKVVDKTKGLSFKEQAVTYNWADVLISIHGASQANAIFMRDGSAAVEVWQCCYEDISGRDDLVKGWTGWLFQRMHMTLSYIGGCTEVDKKGKPLELNDEEKQMEIGELCGLNQHLNPLNVEVPVSKIPGAIRRANLEAIETIGHDPIPPLSLMPEKHSGTQFETRPKVIERQYAPVGPGWTETAIGDDRNVLMRVQHVLYGNSMGKKAGEFWEGAMNRSKGIQPPFGPLKTYDSIIRWFTNVQWDYAWHIGLVPVDTFNSTASVSNSKEEVKDTKPPSPPASVGTTGKEQSAFLPESKLDLASKRDEGGTDSSESESKPLKAMVVDVTEKSDAAGALAGDIALRHRLLLALREPMWFYFFSGALTTAALIGLCNMACRVSAARKNYSALRAKNDRSRSLFGEN